MRRPYAKALLIAGVTAAFLSAPKSESSAQLGVPFYSKVQLDHAVAVQAVNEPAILTQNGVFGIGVGETNGALAITVLVDSTNRASELPAMLDDVPVAVRVVNPIRALACGGSNPQLLYSLPIPLGISAGNILVAGGVGSCASGTIGFKVRDNVSGAVGWVSNSHVVSHGADGCPGTAPIGTTQFQPGPVDTTPTCSAGQNNIGILNRTAPIVFSGANNIVDAAYVQSSDAAISSEILNLGQQVNNVVPAFVGQTLQKNGRTTSCTLGTVSAINLTVPITYDGACGTAVFTNQIMIAPNGGAFAQPGDSGSPVVDANNNAVGLLFAGDALGNGIANPMSAVLNALNVSLSSVTSSQVITRTSRFWFTHGYSSDTNCATLLNAIDFDGGVMDLGFVTVPTANRNSDNVINGTDAFIEALSFYYRSTKLTGEPTGTQSGKLKASSLCAARKKLAVELIAAIANTTILGTFPPNAHFTSGHTVTNFPADLIAQARNAAAGFDVPTIQNMTALLKAFNNSGVTNNLPNGLVECSAQKSKDLKSIARDPMTQETCPGVNDTCFAARTVVFSGVNSVFKDSVSLSSFHDDIPSPACGAGGRDAVWQVVPPVAASGRQFVVSTSGSNFDTMISVWSGSCSNLVPVSCVDNVLGTAGETLQFTTDGQDTFFIVIEGKNGAYGKVDMSVHSF